MSLIKQLKKEAKKKYPEVYSRNNNTFRLFNDQFSKSSFSRIFLGFTLLVTFVILYTLFLDFNIFKILKINFEDNIKVFTTSIITLVSINLFVTNLLFTHLKEERDEIQYIIDNRIHFKFITYLGFTIILFILILYFISPSISNLSVNANILIFIFISFLYYIYKLISLYTIVFNFLNKSMREQIVKAELDSEFFKEFYHFYLKNEFKKTYLEVLTNYGFSRYSSLFSTIEDSEKISISKKFDSFLHDINLKKLESTLEILNDENKRYLQLELNQKFEKNRIHHIFTFKTKQKLRLENYFNIKRRPYLSSTIEKENLNRLLAKVSSNTLNNKFDELGANLNTLDAIYNRYVKMDNND